MPRLEGKVALVTGGAEGLGRAIAARLRSEGAAVLISDIQEAAGQRTASELDLAFMRQDVAEETLWPSVVDRAEALFGRLDILVNNAGALGPMQQVSPECTSLEDWRRLFAINVDSVFLGCRAAIPAMRRAGSGSIINMSSVAGLLATPYATAYGATKAAVRQLTKSVAQHCAQERLKIRCNSVHPGIVLTPLWRRFAAESARERGVTVETVLAEACTGIPLGDLTLAEDVAATVAFLASDDSRHMTGARVMVDGGIVDCDTFRPGAAGQQ